MLQFAELLLPGPTLAAPLSHCSVRRRTGSDLPQSSAVVIVIYLLVCRRKNLSPLRFVFVLIIQIPQLASVLFTRNCKHGVISAWLSDLQESKDG